MRLSRRAAVAGLLASAIHVPAATAVDMAPTTLAVLTTAARSLFPHDQLPDATYAAIVAHTVAGAADPAPLAAAALVLAGPAATIADRIAAYFALPGVQILRIATLIGLYSDLSVVRRFGYPGPSAEAGGYLHRGFNDLDWLSEPRKAWLP